MFVETRIKMLIRFFGTLTIRILSSKKNVANRSSCQIRSLYESHLMSRHISRILFNFLSIEVAI